MPRLKSVEFGSRHKAHLVAVRHLRHGNDPSSSELSVDSGVPRTRRISSIRNPRRQARAKPGAFSIPVHEFPEMSNILRFQASMSARRQYRRRAIRIGCGKFRSGRCSHRHRGISLDVAQFRPDNPGGNQRGLGRGRSGIVHGVFPGDGRCPSAGG